MLTIDSNNDGQAPGNLGPILRYMRPMDLSVYYRGAARSDPSSLPSAYDRGDVQ